VREQHYIFEHTAELKRLSEMVFVEGGTFRMGSEDSNADAEDWEKPAHDVTIDSFYMGKYPVTQVMWKVLMKGENPSYLIGNDLPVEMVSWDEIQVFIEKLNAQTGQKYRLPTEAEWEYTAKGGLYFKDFPCKYAGSNKLNEVGWYSENSYSETKPVGLKSPIFLGVHDMSGNVFEWCSDKIAGFQQDYKNVIEQSAKDVKTGVLLNPIGVVEGTSRVLRGGTSYSNVQDCRSTFRNYYPPSHRDYNIGFRLVFIPLSLGGK
jgi:formylglycine-generating enzyme